MRETPMSDTPQDPRIEVAYHRLLAAWQDEFSPGKGAAADLLAALDALHASRDLFGHDVKVSACHAGLECGVISIAYPDLDMISFGPNIHEAHSEKECCSISSVQKFWKLLTATLAAM
jgi:acetylornithine deacetylase/succinyl-diaminopimelate desuccinylase-like protein